jgi:hypothetical protein
MISIIIENIFILCDTDFLQFFTVRLLFIISAADNPFLIEYKISEGRSGINYNYIKEITVDSALF